MSFAPSLRFVVIGAFGATALGLLALGGSALWGKQTLSTALSTSARATDALNRLRTVSAQAEGFAAAPLGADLTTLGTASSELRRTVADIAAIASEPVMSESLANSLAALDTLPGLFEQTIATANSTAAQTEALADLVAQIDATLAGAGRAAADASVTRFSDLQVSFGPFVKIGGLGEGLAPIASRLGEIETAIGSDDALRALAAASTDAGAATAKRLRFKVERSQRAVVGRLGGALKEIETALKAIAAGSAPGDVKDSLRTAIATADSARGALVGASLTPITEALEPFGDTLTQASALGGAMLDLGKASSWLAALNVALADFRAAPTRETRAQVLSLAGQIAARVAKAEDESKGQVPEIGAAAAAIGKASEALATPLDALIALTGEAAANQSAIRAAMGEVASSIAITSRTIDENGQDQALLVNRLALAAFAISIITLIGAALLVTFRILRPVQSVARRMERLAAGDTEVAAEETKRSDEIGDMLRAFRVFRDNAVERQALQESEAAREAASRAERAALMQRLQQEFGAVVAAGVGGDFSRRIEVRFEDPELAGLADGVNALVASVDAGVAEASRVMGGMAEGDLTIAMSGQFEGAFAALQADVNNTVSSLSALIAEIRSESQEIEQSITSIAQGADALSQRTDAQARSLTETSVAMDAMSQTIEQTGANAHRAASMADEASERADASGAVLNETVEAMGRIESGAQQISDIVSVIDGIAFQTNLLALNAAVEAARAGEAGKGFAIVAQEVRSLAQRAGASAHDIRALIEQSATQVSDGVRLVGQTRETIEAMVTAMKEGAVLVSEINRASIAEKASIEEVASATSELEQTTQQNHQQAGASARAAHGVTEATARLREMLDRFRVDTAADDREAA